MERRPRLLTFCCYAFLSALSRKTASWQMTQSNGMRAGERGAAASTALVLEHVSAAVVPLVIKFSWMISFERRLVDGAPAAATEIKWEAPPLPSLFCLSLSYISSGRPALLRQLTPIARGRSVGFRFRCVPSFILSRHLRTSRLFFADSDRRGKIIRSRERSPFARAAAVLAPWRPQTCVFAQHRS